MALTNLITFNQSSEAEMRRDIHFQLLIILKAFTAMLAGDESLQTVSELTRLKFQCLKKLIPLFALVGLICQTVCSDATQRNRQQMCFWNVLLTHIDIANGLVIAIDLIQPEFWL